MTETTPQSSLRTVQQFSERHPAWTEAALRNLIFKAEARESSRGTIPGNGLIECGAIVRIGRKVLIDEAPFFAWVRAQGQPAHPNPPTAKSSRNKSASNAARAA
ncbi:hypothetical protein [Paraburkholderia tagetis]|uniref:Uncharacterized protein n=1 Tax=Paraburkholderia tagetis TaxID=2913261 RepID=A0A9X1RKI2_9BURK|nr:hypothetical protein [Paraburkholderia tagetis]MCG5073048.1 hypothetical protein [Paraburkholderia tagetis]